jgi:hypothetical protein
MTTSTLRSSPSRSLPSSFHLPSFWGGHTTVRSPGHSEGRLPERHAPASAVAHAATRSTFQPPLTLERASRPRRRSPQKAKTNLRFHQVGRFHDRGGFRRNPGVADGSACKLHGLEPEAYLHDALRVLPHWPRDRYLELAPLNYAATRAHRRHATRRRTRPAHRSCGCRSRARHPPRSSRRPQAPVRASVTQIHNPHPRTRGKKCLRICRVRSSAVPVSP